MHLPDDVAITTSNHHGSQLAALYSLWADLLEAIGDDQDELFAGMLDAVDCFRASTFDSLHGYYRSALSNLRSALELVAIGSLGNLSPNDRDYLRWKKQNVGSLPFSSAMKKLRSVTSVPMQTLIFKPNGWLDAFYQELCRPRAVEHGDRIAPVLAVAIHVGHDRAEQTIRLRTDLMGSAVIDAQGAGASPDIHAEGLPGEGLLEDALAQVAREKEGIGATSAQGGKEPEMGDANVLRLVDDREVEKHVLAL